MQTVICPIDNKPCNPSCPDRYRDEPAGGCLLTTFQELGSTVVIISPKKRKSPPVREHQERQGGKGLTA